MRNSFLSFQDLPAQCPLALVSHEEDRRFGPFDVVPQMKLDAPRRAHAGTGHDDAGLADWLMALESSTERTIRKPGKRKGGWLERISSSVSASRQSWKLSKDLGHIDGHRAVQKDLDRGNPLGVHQPPDVVHQLLGSLDGETWE